jgi:hypothetical protein
MTDTAPALFNRLADRYDQVIPFFAEFASDKQPQSVLGSGPCFGFVMASDPGGDRSGGLAVISLFSVLSD